MRRIGYFIWFRTGIQSGGFSNSGGGYFVGSFFYPHLIPPELPIIDWLFPERREFKRQQGVYVVLFFYPHLIPPELPNIDCRYPEWWYFKQRPEFFGGAFYTILARPCRYKYYTPAVL